MTTDERLTIKQAIEEVVNNAKKEMLSTMLKELKDILREAKENVASYDEPKDIIEKIEFAVSNKMLSHSVRE
jgi:hypothetical protein